MSRQIDLAKKLSEEDRDYLMAWGRYVDVQRNDAQFAEPKSETESEESTGAEKFTDEWFEKATVKDLKHELQELKRPVTGNRDELVSRLEEALLEDGLLEEDDDTA